MPIRKTLAFLLLAGLAPAAHAANWIAIQGTEPADAKPVKLFGFIQGTYEQSFGDPVTGLTSSNLAPHNGHQAIFNTFGGDESTSTFNIRRARLGVRGALEDTKINYFLMAEFGNNAITRVDSVALTDASVTFNYLPGARLRAGRFKMPTMDEALEGNPFAADFINFSAIAAQLVQENRVQAGATPAENAFIGGNSAFRDVGVQVFDWFRQGQMEYTYALAVSNGTPSIGTDDNNDKDVTGRLQASYVFQGPLYGAHRQELSAFVWRGEGKRDYQSDSYRRLRQGVGIHYNRAPWRVRGEYVHAAGMIDAGINPAFQGGTPNVAPTGKAKGWYVQTSYTLTPNWELNLRYDTLNRQYDNAAQERVFKTWTVGGQYLFNPKARLMVNYEFRDLEAPQGNADARRIADAMADRMLAQAVVTF
ncbi:MAG: porin [Pseudomonadota bacterium]